MKHLKILKALKLEQGYILVVTVLFIGAILVATTASLLLLGWAAEQNGVVYSQTNQALEAARGCTDIAIQELRKDSTYAGDETYVLPGNLGECRVLVIQGSGVRDRTICTEGSSGGVTFGGASTRRLLTLVREFFPRVVISRSEEVDATSECGGAAIFSSSSSPGGGSSSSDSSVAVGSSSAASSIAAPVGSSSAASSVAITCGDTSCDAPETCDDGNSTNGDGCSNTCQIEGTGECHCDACTPGVKGLGLYTCYCDSVIIVISSSSSAASSAAGYCGDSVCQSGLTETCDLGSSNGILGSGCDAFCQVTSGYSCTPACGGVGLQSCSVVISSSSSSAAPGPAGPAGPIEEGF